MVSGHGICFDNRERFRHFTVLSKLFFQPFFFQNDNHGELVFKSATKGSLLCLGRLTFFHSFFLNVIGSRNALHDQKVRELSFFTGRGPSACDGCSPIVLVPPFAYVK